MIFMSVMDTDNTYLYHFMTTGLSFIYLTKFDKITLSVITKV